MPTYTITLTLNDVECDAIFTAAVSQLGTMQSFFRELDDAEIHYSHSGKSYIGLMLALASSHAVKDKVTKALHDAGYNLPPLLLEAEMNLACKDFKAPDYPEDITGPGDKSCG